MSAVVISLIPILIFFALVQKNLVQGLSAGAVKDKYRSDVERGNLRMNFKRKIRVTRA